MKYPRAPEWNPHRAEGLPITEAVGLRRLRSFPIPPVRGISQLQTVRATSGNTRTWRSIAAHEHYSALKSASTTVFGLIPNFDLLMLGRFSLLALALTVVDVYAVMAHSVSQPAGRSARDGQSSPDGLQPFRLAEMVDDVASTSSKFVASAIASIMRRKRACNS